RARRRAPRGRPRPRLRDRNRAPRAVLRYGCVRHAGARPADRRGGGRLRTRTRNPAAGTRRCLRDGCLSPLHPAGCRFRHGPVLVALPAAALYGIYGIYALPWVIALALLALALARPGLRAFALAVIVFVVAIAVEIPGSIHYWHHGHTVIAKGTELGPLAAPL